MAAHARVNDPLLSSASKLAAARVPPSHSSPKPMIARSVSEGMARLKHGTKYCGPVAMRALFTSRFRGCGQVWLIRANVRRSQPSDHRGSEHFARCQLWQPPRTTLDEPMAAIERPRCAWRARRKRRTSPLTASNASKWRCCSEALGVCWHIRAAARPLQSPHCSKGFTCAASAKIMAEVLRVIIWTFRLERAILLSVNPTPAAGVAKLLPGRNRRKDVFTVCRRAVRTPRVHSCGPFG